MTTDMFIKMEILIVDIIRTYYLYMKYLVISFDFPARQCCSLNINLFLSLSKRLAKSFKRELHNISASASIKNLFRQMSYVFFSKKCDVSPSHRHLQNFFTRKGKARINFLSLIFP